MMVSQTDLPGGSGRKYSSISRSILDLAELETQRTGSRGMREEVESMERVARPRYE